MRLTRLGGLCVLAGLLALPAGAQTQRPPSDSALIGAGMLAKQKQKAVAPDVPAPPSAWPRLERGTVFCRTQDDLQRRAARLRGEQAAPADCRAMAVPTAIQIVHRAGPGATEVRLTAQNETGWTDAWLPANPPPGTVTATGGR